MGQTSYFKEKGSALGANVCVTTVLKIYWVIGCNVIRAIANFHPSQYCV